MKNYFTKFEALNGYLVALISYFLCSFLLSFILVALNLSENMTATLIVSILGTLSFLTPLLIFRKNTKISKAIKLNKNIDFKIVLLCSLISIVSIFGFLGISDVLNYILTQIGYNVSSAEWLQMNNFGDFLFILFAIGVMPAFCEEILFRGICYNGLKEKNKVLAVLVSAFLFMVMHMNLQQSIYQFALGIVYAMVLSITGNVIYTMIMHFVNNGFVVLIAYISQLSNITSTEEVSSSYTHFLDYFMPIMLMVIAIMIIAGLVQSIKNISDKNKQKIINKNIYSENENADFIYKNNTENIDTPILDNQEKILSSIDENTLNTDLELGYNQNIKKYTEFDFVKKLIIVISFSLILYILFVLMNFV